MADHVELPRWLRAGLWLVACLAVPVFLTVQGAQRSLESLRADDSLVNWLMTITLVVITPIVFAYAAIQIVRKVPSSQASDGDRSPDEQIDDRTTL